MSFLTIENLSAHVGPSPILRDVSLSVEAGEVRGLVGESGAGKSMIGKAVLGTLPLAVQVTSGRILLDGEDLLAMRPRDRRRVIGAKAALIPQDPLTALNPSRRVGPQITNRLVDILGWTRQDAQMRALELLHEVSIPEPERVMRAYPHELSGGMRQRILIASAFAAEPRLIIADEPTTALDVTVQKQILKLIRQMQQRHGTALLFVTHDLGVVSKVCQSLTVLFGGLVLEDTRVEPFFAHPSHPYSAALLAATPKYTDPDASLTPVPDAVIEGVQAEIAAHDRMQPHV
ncbi:ABC transporter ATP-binding protein [Antarcticimicrobium sediminis]|uniref:ABC transporter ATP-binding protein n=1 Tax=Antarcticimicrobium sediminis TaxID=2546227 RepID=A0A4V6PG95_9RHOB|nr:ABC transporter ATP-binding protein [Antarcticimicrobium sediminis]TDE39806.1 ABC transporter ATP-binding protein [Antarcticimicrobium sediminis]